MFYGEMAVERQQRLRHEAEQARRVRGVVSVWQAERRLRRARTRLATAKLQLAKVG